jgi:hypothetical protein
MRTADREMASQERGIASEKVLGRIAPAGNRKLEARVSSGRWDRGWDEGEKLASDVYNLPQPR